MKEDFARTFQFEVLKFDEPTFGSNYVFDQSTMERAVNMYMQHYDVEGPSAHNKPRYLGQLGPADSPNVRLDLMSHTVMKLFVEPRHRALFVQIKTLNTRCGLILQEMIEADPASVKPGLRGIGTLTSKIYGDQTVHHVHQDYQLLGVDMHVLFDPIYKGPKSWSTINDSQ